MKIVYSIDSIGNSGGVERVLSTKVNYLVDVFHYEVHIIVGGMQPDDLFYSFSDKIHFHYLDIPLPAFKPCNVMFSNKAVKQYHRKLSRLLHEIRPDITVSTFGRDASFLYKIDDGSKKVLEFHFTKRYLLHLANALKNDRLRLIRKIWLQYLLRRQEKISAHYDHIVLLTERDKQLWGGGDRFTVIPNPLSFVTEQSALLKNALIISMGRLVYPKGFQYLLQAFNLLHAKYPGWRVFVYGDGQDRDLLQKEINILSLQDFFILKVPVQQVESVMMDASLFVLPSLYDGFGLVLTEAMVCGVPCVAFDCECGPSEIIRDGEDGLLVETRNVQVLANAMERLMQDMHFRKTMGGKAKQNVMRFHVHSIMMKWNVFFSNIIN